jgi:hypothetical protein
MHQQIKNALAALLVLGCATAILAQTNNWPVQLNAVIQTGGAATTVWFQYGTNDLATGTSTVVIDGSVTTTNVGMTVSNLWCCVNYSYRVVASNSFGTSFGALTNFMVEPFPSVPTMDPTSITDTNAVANAVAGPSSP